MVIRARLPRGDGGFTLVEMLAAMLVLAIGLLGVQALGVGAARIIARADFQTEAVAAATAAMEARQQAIHAGRWVSGAAEGCDTETVSRVEVCISVQTGGGSPARLLRITVRAVHPQLVSDTFSITSYVHDPSTP